VLVRHIEEVPMSSGPPQTPPTEAIFAAYAPPPQDARNGLAIAALALGILGVVTCFPLFGVLGLIFGIIAVVRANALPLHQGRGMAIAGICCGGVSVLMLPLMIAILLPSLSRVHWSTKRAVCASNLRGIGMGMKVYANDNADWYPTTPFAERPARDGAAAEVSFIGQMGAHRTQPLASADYAKVHPSRALFMLVIDGSCTPKQFICPSSGDSEDDLRNTVGGAVCAAVLGRDRFDFRGYPFESYGYQLPFGPHATANEDLDPSVAILADKGPFFEAGTPAATGQVPDRPVAATPPGTAITLPNLNNATAMLQADSRVWRPFNSRNHGGEGQNVLFVDGHVEFRKQPIVGVNYDNIYTQQGGYQLEDALLGWSPQDRQGPLTETDSIIVP
jgi:prepilin-type processing-associated H-X9-DG protein